MLELPWESRSYILAPFSSLLWEYCHVLWAAVLCLVPPAMTVLLWNYEHNKSFFPLNPLLNYFVTTMKSLIFSFESFNGEWILNHIIIFLLFFPKHLNTLLSLVHFATCKNLSEKSTRGNKVVLEYDLWIQS